MKNENEQKNINEEALKYISLGLSVIPLGLISKDFSGRKIIEYPKDGWKKYQNNIATIEEVNLWNCKNIGIATGQVSNLLVLDTDSYKEGFDNELLKSFNLPITPVQETASGGRQYFFRLPEGLIIKNAVCIGNKDSGIDIRAEGGMVICPPSKTPYGEYSWIISPFDTLFADIPPKILELLNVNSDAEFRVKKTLPELVGLKEGEGRNTAMASFIGKLLNTTSKGDWEKEVWPMAKEVNLTYKPPLEDSELRSVYESITKIADTNNNNLKNIFQTNSKKGSLKIAKYLIEKYYIKTIGERIREIYIYENGVYVLGSNILRADIQEILEELTTINNKNNIMEMVKDLTLANREDFNIDRNLINLNNGIFNIKNNELIPHSHEYLFFTKIPVDYDLNAKCPIIEKFINEILPEYYKKIILEWFGYCLYRSYFIKKAIIFVGERDTGKSTLLKLYKAFVGGENMSGVSLQKISSDKFASSQLRDKHINIYDDLSFKDINDNGLFKVATGDGIITGEKKFGEQFQFQNFSKLTFACNKIPEVKDINDDAYFARWIIIPFLVEIKKVDKTLTEKITNPRELSGLLNLAISRLLQIIEKQDFSYDKTPEEIKEEMLLSGSMVANFARECLEEQAGEWVSKDDMYEECARYAQSNDLAVINSNLLGRRLPNHSGYIIAGTKLINKKQVQGWRNVKIISKKEVLVQEGKEGIFDFT